MLEKNTEKISILVPVYNEALAIGEVLRRVYLAPLPEKFSKEIIIVDDGSTDHTVEVIQNFVDSIGKDATQVKVHKGLVNHGKGAAVRAGFKLCTGEIIIIQDGDLEYSPQDYPALLAPFDDEKVQVVYGSRFFHGFPKNMKFLNLLANLILSFLTRVMYSSPLTDEATGYKVFRRSVLEKFTLVSRGFEFCPEFTSKVLQAKIRIVEVPISYDPRGILEGKKIKMRDGFIAIYWLFKLRIKSWVGPKARQAKTAVCEN
jgi:dolichol-phosphate mannosyltransferase